jgi:outer membrane protein with beta-barrel domain
MRFFFPFLVVFAVSLPAAGHATTTMASVEAMTSTVFQENQTSFSGLAARVTFRSDAVTPGLSFVPGIEYWRNHTQVSAYQIDANRRDATLNLDARYEFHFRNVEPYLGAGYGLHFLSTEVEAPALGIQRAETSLIKGGVSAIGGVLFPMGGKLQNFLELKYHHVTDYNQTKLNFGIAYRF